MNCFRAIWFVVLLLWVLPFAFYAFSRKIVEPELVAPPWMLEMRQRIMDHIAEERYAAKRGPVDWRKDGF